MLYQNIDIYIPKELKTNCQIYSESRTSFELDYFDTLFDGYDYSPMIEEIKEKTKLWVNEHMNKSCQDAYKRGIMDYSCYMTDLQSNA